MSDTDASASGATPAKHHIGYVDGLNVAISLCLTYTLCVTLLRGWIRRRLYGWDDIVVAIATVRPMFRRSINLILLPHHTASWLTSLRYSS